MRVGLRDQLWLLLLLGHRVDSRVTLDGEEVACCDLVLRGNAFWLVKYIVWVHEEKPFSCFAIHRLKPRTYA